jgi:hypothetical protein
MHSHANVSSFYLGNEELAREITRLVSQGALSNLIDILNEYGLTLGLEARREEQGLKERIGFLGHPEKVDPQKSPRKLPLFQKASEDPLLQANDETRPVWDPLASLCVRSRFTIVRKNGSLEEVYMPDHICPECLNELGNKIDACSRLCVMCDFQW